MYDIILDVGKDECVVWVGSRFAVIKGTAMSICSEIWSRTMLWVDTPNGGERVQIKSIAVDSTVGLGVVYIDCLHSMGVEAKPIRMAHIDDILPSLN